MDGISTIWTTERRRQQNEIPERGRADHLLQSRGEARESPLGHLSGQRAGHHRTGQAEAQKPDLCPDAPGGSVAGAERVQVYVVKLQSTDQRSPGGSRGFFVGGVRCAGGASESTALRFRGCERLESPVEAWEGVSSYRPPRAGRGTIWEGASWAGPPSHLGSCGSLYGPGGPVRLDTPQGRKTCGRVSEEGQNSGTSTPQGWRIQAPRRGIRRAKGPKAPFCFAKTEILISVGERQNAGENTARVSYRERERASTGLSRLEYPESRAKVRGRVFSVGKIRGRKNEGYTKTAPQGRNAQRGLKMAGGKAL